MKKRRVKRRLKVDRLILVIVLGIGLALGTYFGIRYLLKSNNDKPINKPSEEEKEKVYTASVITAGDNLIHSSLYQDANKNANYSGYDFKPMYELIKPIVSNYDIKYYNQETILGGTELGLKSYPVFNSPYEVGDAMILAVGSYSSTEERNEVHVEEANGITYTMLNYTYGTNGIRVPSGKEYLVNVWPTDTDNINNPDVDTKYQEYKNTVKEDIDRVRDKVDVLIVAMHWGVEYTHEPTRYEKDMAQFLSDNGVDVIIGTHPHVIQPVTYINDTLVIYSLGNLISAQYQNQDTCTNYKCMVGAMTGFKIIKTVKGNDKTIKISDVSTELIYTYYKNWRNFKVVPFSNEKIKDYLPSYMKTYETYKTVIQKYDSNMYVVPAYE